MTVWTRICDIPMHFLLILVVMLQTCFLTGHSASSSGLPELQAELYDVRGQHEDRPRRHASKAEGQREGRDGKSIHHRSKHHRQKTCTELTNHGTHFTVEIEVGTPGQKFDVVADTGSDAIIVPSCACVKAGFCNPDSRCFQGTNRSSTFAIDDGPNGPPTIRMMFGSGPVQAVVASDQVRVGGLHTKMEDGILLMTDQLLNIKGQFEGILGLGLPAADAKKGLYQQGPEGAPGQPESPAASSDAPPGDRYVQGSASGKDSVVTSSQNSDGVNIFPFEVHPGASGHESESEQVHLAKTGELIPAPGPIMNLAPTSFLDSRKPSKKLNQNNGKKDRSESSYDEDPANSSGIVVKGFMEEAGINRFSMCFNDGANGVLRLGTHKAEQAHGSVGQVHWGLDFRGISVGDASAPVEFCKTKNMSKGQKTPCGAIPDSGTTAFMAPKDHVISLYESLCDRWDRCNKNYTAMVKAADDAKAAAIKAFNVDPFSIEPASKAMIFQALILDCRHWLTKNKGLNELPDIHFHIGGANGTKQTLNLGGWSYIIETQEKEFKYIYKKVPGLGKMPVGKNFTGHSRKVCSPAFSTMEYSTEQNGPVWILGTPIFYEYQVGYDMHAKPPAISFSDEPCGSCDGENTKKASFVSQNVKTSPKGERPFREPRYIEGPFRKPALDFTKPF